MILISNSRYLSAQAAWRFAKQPECVYGGAWEGRQGERQRRVVARAAHKAVLCATIR